MTIEEPVLQTQLPLVSVGTSTDIIVATTRDGDLFFDVDDRRQRVFELTSHRVCITGNVPGPGLLLGGPVQVPNGGPGLLLGQVPNGGPVQVPNGGPGLLLGQVPNGVPSQAIIPSDEFSDVFPMFFPKNENIMDQVNDVYLDLDLTKKRRDVTPPRPRPDVESNYMRNCILVGIGVGIGSCMFAYGLYTLSGYDM